MPATLDQHSAPVAQTSAVSDSERLERELEGGGAPSQRRRGHQAGLLTRLWRIVFRPTVTQRER
jgi:hypothetical protein